jgi:hypothetical protein
VNDAPAGVPALEAQREPPVLVEVEGDTALAQVADGVRRLVDQDLDGRRAAEPTPGGDGVRRMAGGRVAGLQRRSQTALSPIAGALRQRGA